MEHATRRCGISLGSVGGSSLDCPLTTPCAHPAPFWFDGVRSRKGLESVSAAAKYPCIVNIISSPNTKHSPLPPTMKNTNSVPAKTSTKGYHFFLLEQRMRLSSDFRGINSFSYQSAFRAVILHFFPMILGPLFFKTSFDQLAAELNILILL